VGVVNSERAEDIYKLLEHICSHNKFHINLSSAWFKILIKCNAAYWRTIASNNVTHYQPFAVILSILIYTGSI
jgi:hypothetical protein